MKARALPVFRTLSRRPGWLLSTSRFPDSCYGPHHTAFDRFEPVWPGRFLGMQATPDCFGRVSAPWPPTSPAPGSYCKHSGVRLLSSGRFPIPEIEHSPRGSKGYVSPLRICVPHPPYAQVCILPLSPICRDFSLEMNSAFPDRQPSCVRTPTF